MVCFPNAKINLGLHILAKRPDGYHEIESCLYPLPWCDILEIIPSDTNQFTTSGIPVPGNKDENLCLKAYKLLRGQHGLPPVHIHLHKVIPMGAGLGGGSANGAFTLTLLNQLFSLNISSDELRRMASELGSDCPFFIKNAPALAIGTGTAFSNIAVELRGYYIMVVLPGIHVSTKEAYAGVTPKLPDLSINKILEKKPVVEWTAHLKNDFEDSIFLKFPKIAALKEKLYQQGAVYASMTGSGSAVYGIFDHQPSSLSVGPSFTIWQSML